MNIFRQYFERLRTFYNGKKIRYLVKKGKLHYGRQEVMVRRADEPYFAREQEQVAKGAHVPLLMKNKITVGMKVFRAKTGKWEDHGIVASSEMGNAHIVRNPNEGSK